MAPEILAQLGRGRVAFSHILAERLADDVVEITAELTPQPPRRRLAPKADLHWRQRRSPAPVRAPGLLGPPRGIGRWIDVVREPCAVDLGRLAGPDPVGPAAGKQ